MTEGKIWSWMDSRHFDFQTLIYLITFPSQHFLKWKLKISALKRSMEFLGLLKAATTDKSCYFLLKMFSNLYNLDHSLCTDHNKNSLMWSKSSKRSFHFSFGVSAHRVAGHILHAEFSLDVFETKVAKAGVQSLWSHLWSDVHKQKCP